MRTGPESGRKNYQQTLKLKTKQNVSKIIRFI